MAGKFHRGDLVAWRQGEENGEIEKVYAPTLFQGDGNSYDHAVSATEAEAAYLIRLRDGNYVLKNESELNGTSAAINPR